MFDLAGMLGEHFSEEEKNELMKPLKEEWSELEKEDESDGKNSSYYHFVSEKYENGKRVEHKEKIVRDGEVIKDVEQCTCLADKKEDEAPKVDDKCSKAEEKNDELSILKNENKELKARIAEVEATLKEKVGEAADLSDENAKLRAKLESIKNMF
jgi:hypothetical protein